MLIRRRDATDSATRACRCSCYIYTIQSYSKEASSGALRIAIFIGIVDLSGQQIIRENEDQQKQIKDKSDNRKRECFSPQFVASTVHVYIYFRSYAGTGPPRRLGITSEGARR